MVEAELESK